MQTQNWSVLSHIGKSGVEGLVSIYNSETHVDQTGLPTGLRYVAGCGTEIPEHIVSCLLSDDFFDLNCFVVFICT